MNIRLVDYRLHRMPGERPEYRLLAPNRPPIEFLYDPVNRALLSLDYLAAFSERQQPDCDFFRAAETYAEALLRADLVVHHTCRQFYLDD